MVALQLPAIRLYNSSSVSRRMSCSAISPGSYTSANQAILAVSDHLFHPPHLDENHRQLKVIASSTTLAIPS